MAQGLLRQCDMPDLLYDASQMINTYVSFFFYYYFFFYQRQNLVLYAHYTKTKHINKRGKY